jgi:hypothetical protein
LRWEAVTSYMVHPVCQMPRTRSTSFVLASSERPRGRATIATVKKAAKRTLGAGLVAGFVYGAFRAYRARAVKAVSETSWEAAPFPFPPIPRPASPSRAPATNGAAPAADPVDGECPDSYPVKGKLSSGIYHVPGGLNSARTRPARCYVDSAAAESDGLRPAKR